MKKKIKILVGVLLVLAVAATIFFTTGGQKGSQEALELDASVMSQVTDICSDGERFYLVTRNDILTCDDRGELQDTWHFDDVVLSHITYADALYAFDWLNGRLLKISGEGEIDEELKIEETIENVEYLSSTGQYLYLAASVVDGETHRTLTYQIDFVAGTVEEIADQPVRMYPYRGEGLLQQVRGALFLRESGGGEYTRILPANSGIGAATCDDRDEWIYFVDSSGISRYREDQVEFLHTLPSQAEDIAIAGDRILVLCPGESVILATKEAEEAGDTLTVYGMNDYYSIDGRAVMLNDEYRAQTGKDVNSIQAAGTSFDQFLTDIMSGSDRYDIYAIRTTQADVAGFKENHAFYDLSGSQILAQAVNEMYTPVAESAWVGEELFGIPWDTDGEMMCYIPSQNPGYSPETFTSWDAFLDVAQERGADGVYRMMDARLSVTLMEQYMARYCDVENAQYNFDTEEFRQVLRLLRRIEEMDLPQSAVGGMTVAGELFPEGMTFGWADLSSYEKGQEISIVYPSIAGETGSVTAKQTYLVVNPNSENKEQAIDYLEFICQNPYVRQNVLLYADENCPEIAELMEHHLVYLTDSHVDMSELFEIINAYCEGTLDEEETIRQITEKVGIQVHG